MATISRGTKAERFQFIEQHRGRLKMALLYKQLNVSKSGFYHWLKREESERHKADQRLLIHITGIFKKSRGIYGSPRIHQALQKMGIFVGRKRVARLMKLANLKARFAKVYRFKSSYGQRFVSKNLRANADKPTAINQHWTSDLTYLRLGKDWVYLVVILDLYSRRVVSWSLGKEKTTALVIRALDLAVKKRQPEKGLLFHSDRGSEYVSRALNEKIVGYGMVRSMSRAYRSIDNAEMESFFQKLKGEYLKGRTHKTLKQVRKDVTSYINRFYNPKRLHSSLGYVSPMEFEARVA